MTRILWAAAHINNTAFLSLYPYLDHASHFRRIKTVSSIQSPKCVFESWFPISCFLYKTFHIIKILSASLQFICGQAFQQIFLRPPPVRQPTLAVDSAAHHLSLKKKTAGGSNYWENMVCQICCYIWRIFLNFTRLEIITTNTIKKYL